MLPLTASRAAGPNRGLAACVEASFGGKPQDANSGCAPPTRVGAEAEIRSVYRTYRTDACSDSLRFGGKQPVGWGGIQGSRVRAPLTVSQAAILAQGDDAIDRRRADQSKLLIISISPLTGTF